MQIVNFISNVLLIRLLAPEHFGVYVTPFIVFSLARTLQDFGTTSIFYTLKEIPTGLKREILGFNIITTLAIGTFLLLIGPNLVFFWTGSKISEEIMFWLSLSYLFTTPHIFHDTLLKHQMKFKQLFRINMVVTLLSTSVGIIIALNEGHYWSLVVKHLVYIISGASLLLLFSGEKIIPLFQFTEIKQYKNFSLPLITTQMMGFFSRNADNLLINRFMGEYSLGIYERAYRFLTLPIDQISGTISKVLLPGLTQSNNDDEHQKKLLRFTIQLIFIAVVPISGILTIFTEEFVQILFGSQWKDLVPLLRIFGTLILFQTLTPTLYNLFLVKNKTVILMRLNFISQPIHVFIFIIFTYFYPDLQALALSYACFSVVFSLIFWHVSLSLIQENLGFVFRSLKSTFIYNLFIITWFVIIKSLTNFITNPYHISAFILFGLIIYGLSLFKYNNNFSIVIQGMIKRKL
jgi:PST family polysaccharide transporter